MDGSTKVFNRADLFRENQVFDCGSVEEFVKKYTKKNRYRDYMVESYSREVALYGFTFITHHNSVTGEYVSWYPPQEESKDGT